MFNKHDLNRDQYMLTGIFANHGYDWWWHSFTAIDAQTKKEQAFFVEFFLINPAIDQGKEIIHGENGKNHPSYLMVKCGTWGEENKCQLHRFFPISQVEIHKKAPYSIKAEDCLACETALKGKVEVSKKEEEEHHEYLSDYGSMFFDLKLEKNITFNVGYGAGKLFRDLKAFEMYWHAEGIKTLYEGEVILNGRKYIVTKDTSYGYADKNWGSNFTSPWVWLASSNMYSKKYNKPLTNSAFDIGGGKPKVFGIPLNRKLLGVLYYEGQQMEFNFSKFWDNVKTEFNFDDSNEQVHWFVHQQNRNNEIEVDIYAMKKDLLFINYEDPDGLKKFKKLYNGGNGKGTIKVYRKIRNKKRELIDEIEVSNVGCEYGEFSS